MLCSAAITQTELLPTGGARQALIAEKPASKPLRMSVWPIASHTHAPAGRPIIVARRSLHFIKDKMKSREEYQGRLSTRPTWKA
jgi:hypothetical protein